MMDTSEELITGTNDEGQKWIFFSDALLSLGDAFRAQPADVYTHNPGLRSYTPISAFR